LPDVQTETKTEGIRTVERRLGVLLSGTQGKTNNTTHFVHLWLLPLWGFRSLLAIVNPYKPQTRGPVRAHPRPYEFIMDQ
jgi:hypothetical protein